VEKVVMVVAVIRVTEICEKVSNTLSKDIPQAYFPLSDKNQGVKLMRIKKYLDRR
jgi:hypothetical protein